MLPRSSRAGGLELGGPDLRGGLGPRSVRPPTDRQSSGQRRGTVETRAGGAGGADPPRSRRRGVGTQVTGRAAQAERDVRRRAGASRPHSPGSKHGSPNWRTAATAFGPRRITGRQRSSCRRHPCSGPGSPAALRHWAGGRNPRPRWSGFSSDRPDPVRSGSWQRDTTWPADRKSRRFPSWKRRSTSGRGPTRSMHRRRRRGPCSRSCGLPGRRDYGRYASNRVCAEPASVSRSSHAVVSSQSSKIRCAAGPPSSMNACTMSSVRVPDAWWAWK